jgi:uroporphyrinogen decarboxylase
MNARERFLATCRFEPVDRPFRWETLGFWPETIVRWHDEGLPRDVDDYLTYAHFGMDLRIPIFIGTHEDPGFFPQFEEQVTEETDAYRIRRNSAGAVVKEFKNNQSALPQFLDFPVRDMRTFEAIRWRFEPSISGRLGSDWEERARAYNDADVPIVVYVCGLFGLARHLLGFENLMFAYTDMPELIHAIGAQWVTMHTSLLEHIAAGTKVDAVSFWEDMAYRNGPMIGPATFREFMTPYYTRVTDCARSLGIDVLIVDTDGDCSRLIPLFLDAGVNMLLPFEVQAGMDVREVRKRYGKRLIIEGGLDKRALAKDFTAIRDEVESKVPMLLREGGYFPALDHNVPPDVPLKNFEFFLRCVRDRNAGGP